jgi:hypothetical protein
LKRGFPLLTARARHEAPAPFSSLLRIHGETFFIQSISTCDFYHLGRELTLLPTCSKQFAGTLKGCLPVFFARRRCLMNCAKLCPQVLDFIGGLAQQLRCAVFSRVKPLVAGNAVPAV